MSPGPADSTACAPPARRPFLARTRAAVSVLLAALLVPAAWPQPARASTEMSRVVSADPVDWTPHITDGAVWALAVVGDTVVVGGDFTTVTDADGTASHGRRYLMAFGLGDGAVTHFHPELDGPVRALAAGPDGSVIVGGNFTTVNGTAHQSLARLDVATGRAVPGFEAPVAGDVRALAVHGSALYVGGGFGGVSGVVRTGLARLDVYDGKVDTGFDAELGDAVRGRPRVEAMTLSPDGTRLVAVGDFATSHGQPRAQMAMLDVGGSGSPVTDWYTSYYQKRCDPRFDTYLREVDFSPDGRYLVAVTTGHDSGPDMPCDTAARFEAGGAGDHPPTWVNHTGGDSLFSVAVTGSAVYVGGHERWLDNPDGQKTPGPGAVDRLGIAAIDPVSGLALSWNPTRDRGEGVRAFAVCPQGLLVGSDTDRLGHEYHGRIGLFPVPGIETARSAPVRHVGPKWRTTGPMPAQATGASQR